MLGMSKSLGNYISKSCLVGVQLSIPDTFEKERECDNNYASTTDTIDITLTLGDPETLPRPSYWLSLKI